MNKYDGGMKTGALLASIANELHTQNCLKVIELKTKGISQDVIDKCFQNHNF